MREKQLRRVPAHCPLPCLAGRRWARVADWGCDTGRAWAGALGSRPVSTGRPTVIGTTTVGSILACSGPRWNHNPTSFIYPWMVDGTAIGGAHGPAYTLPQSSLGHLMSCAITASNGAGSTTAVSPSVGPIRTRASSCQAGQTGTPPQCSAPRACIVPQLRHMTLRQATLALRRAHCRLGRVYHPKHVRKAPRTSRQQAISSSPRKAPYRLLGRHQTRVIGEPPNRALSLASDSTILSSWVNET